MPTVSVLMTVHNGLPYVESALRSIMEQTLCDIEIVVVDDASTDATPEVLARLAAEDPRIRVETLAQNLRQARAANRGLELVRAPLVARMDADDLCPPHRLAVQKAYLDAHPDVVLVAASARHIDTNGKLIRIRRSPLDDFAARWLMRFKMPLIHSSFLFRRAGDGGALSYDPDLKIAEDYGLLARAARAGGVVCLPDLLVDYRVHADSTMRQRSAEDERFARDVARDVQDTALPPDLAGLLDPFMEMEYGSAAPTPARLRGAARAFRRIIREDAKARPDLVRWMRRQAAMLLFYILRRDRSNRDALLYLLRHAPDLALHAGLQFLDARYGVASCQPDV